MDRFHAIQTFGKVAESGGVRAVAMLEERLGTRLFVRPADGKRRAVP